MATFTEIYYNGNEYKQMWLNGTKVWEKASGEVVVLPYPQYDIYGTIRVCNNYNSDTYQLNFDVIDSSLPYSINGVETKSYTTPKISKNSYEDITLGLKNLYPRFNVSSGNVGSGWIKFEQFYLPKNVNSMYYCFKTTFSTYGGDSYFTFPTKYSYATKPTFPYLDTSNITDMRYCFYMDLPASDGIYQYRPTTFDLSSWNTSKVATMRSMFNKQTALTTLNVDGWDVSNVTDMAYMFYGCSSLTSLDLSSFNTSSLTSTDWMFANCSALKEIHLENFDTRNVTNYSLMFSGITDCTIYIGENWTLSTNGSDFNALNLTFIPTIPTIKVPIESIGEINCNLDISNINEKSFTISPNIAPSNYTRYDLEVIYDESYMKTDDKFTFELLDGCQGKTFDITYRSKTDNSISKTITITVSQDLEFPTVIDFTQSTAPTLPSYMILDGQGSSYYFKHGTYTTDVYGLVPNNSGLDSTIAYTRYKYVAPKDGVLTFTYRCYAEMNYDYLTVHVDTSTSQPNYTSSTNRVFTTKGVSSYENTDGTASVNVTSGTTYYIHIQYRKDNSNSNGYDKGCIRKIELL